MSQQKRFAILEIIVGILVVGTIAIIGILYLQDPKNGAVDQTHKPPTPTQITQPSRIPSQDPPNGNLPQDDWNSYTNSKYGYQLQYPPEYQVKEWDENVCPTQSGGCVDVKKKGDVISIHNTQSHLIIEINEDFEYPNTYGTCYSQDEITHSPIIVDNVSMQLILNAEGFFLNLVPDYEIKDQLICPGYIWSHQGNKIRVRTSIQGTTVEDTPTITQILETLQF